MIRLQASFYILFYPIKSKRYFPDLGWLISAEDLRIVSIKYK